MSILYTRDGLCLRDTDGIVVIGFAPQEMESWQKAVVDIQLPDVDDCVKERICHVVVEAKSVVRSIPIPVSGVIMSVNRQFVQSLGSQAIDDHTFLDTHWVMKMRAKLDPSASVFITREQYLDLIETED